MLSLQILCFPSKISPQLRYPVFASCFSYLLHFVYKDDKTDYTLMKPSLAGSLDEKAIWGSYSETILEGNMGYNMAVKLCEYYIS